MFLQTRIKHDIFYVWYSIGPFGVLKNIKIDQFFHKLSVQFICAFVGRPGLEKLRGRDQSKDSEFLNYNA